MSATHLSEKNSVMMVTMTKSSRGVVDEVRRGCKVGCDTICDRICRCDRVCRSLWSTHLSEKNSVMMVTMTKSASKVTVNTESGVILVACG